MPLTIARVTKMTREQIKQGILEAHAPVLAADKQMAISHDEQLLRKALRILGEIKSGMAVERKDKTEELLFQGFLKEKPEEKDG